MYEELYQKGQTDEESVKRLKNVIHVLRQENGCPWDREQTHESLRRCLIEESYEVVEAINRKDIDNLEEELGDVLLQVVMHAEIAEERSDFDLKSVANRVSEKMIHRHPHVFNVFEGKNNRNMNETIDNALERWENVKRKEHAEMTTMQSMEKIPLSLPALIRSEKIQKKAAKVGFDWDGVEDAFAKAEEEIAELKEAYASGEKGHIKEELGDLLFSAVNIARFLEVDPEEALGLTSDKFIRRFSHIENQAIAQDKKLEDMTLPEMDKLWDEAKMSEK